MAESHSSTRPKPGKPTPDYPLTAHQSGKWCKKIKGRIYYFGTWDDPEGALEEYLTSKRDLEKGRTKPSSVSRRLTVKQLIDAFLTAKEKRRDVGDISPRTFSGLHSTGRLMADFFGRQTPVESLRPEDFAEYRGKIAMTRNAVSVGNEITRVKQFFHWAWKSDLIDRPVKFGPEFARPSMRSIRLQRNSGGKRTFTREQCHALLDECGVHLKAMVLVALNCGMGNSDLATLPIDVIDFQTGWVDYCRRKTGTQRRFRLWPETLIALQASLLRRPVPDKGNEHLFFIRPSGKPWGVPEKSTCPISKRTRAALLNAEIYRKGLSFYSLRHTFRTIADAVKDQPAADVIMGHTDPSIRATYREYVDDARLEAITNHVRSWLFPGQPTGEGQQP